jgi:multidrug efflux pump subunit AcrA (membrane-fusion protein)
MTDDDSTIGSTGAGAPPMPPAPPPQRQTPQSGGSARWILLCLAIGIVVFGGGYWYFHRPAAAPAPEAAAAPPPALPVTVSKPQTTQVTEWDEFTGQFEAVDSVEIRARVSGYLDTIGFQDGQMVNKGDLLFVIDPRPFQITLNSAQSALNSANARLTLAKQQLERAQKLKQSDFTPQSTLDQRQQELLSSAADAQVAQAAINSAQLNRLARSDPAGLRHERGGFPRLPAPCRRGQDAVEARRRYPGRGASQRRDRVDAQGQARLRQQ